MLHDTQLCITASTWLSVLRTAALLMLLAMVPTSGWAQDVDLFEESDDPSVPKTWAILVGVEGYEKATPLQYTVDDVTQLASTLAARGGIKRQHLLTITDKREEEAFRPRKAPLMDRLTEWLAKPGAKDTIIVYFSGHGFLDDTGKMYLAPLDCDPNNPAPTGIPVEWFRDQLASCKASVKLLILDACHAGSEKGETARGIDSSELSLKFELERVVTIASCQAHEKSLIWEAKCQSLFSYWLNQGLRGHADEGLTGEINIENLYNYVSRNVKRTADVRFGRKQTPVRKIGFGIDGSPAIIKLRPQYLEEMIGEMAEQLAYALEERKMTKVGVLPFISLSPSGDESMGGQFGLFGKYCAEQLERQLQDRSNGRFSVVDRRRLQASLKDCKFQIKDLGSPRSLESLSKGAGGFPVLAVGSLIHRQGHLLRMQCKLQQTDDDADLGVSTGGTVALNVNQWGMLGRSAVINPEDRRIDVRTANGNGDSSVDAQVIDRLEQRSESPRSHPHQNPQFAFRITLTVNDKPRKGEFRGNEYFVPVREGEKYKLVIENNSGDIAVMRLLVDGLNTLPESEKDKSKGIVVESWGQQVSLDECRAWILDPKDPSLRGGPPRWTVSGFATKTGAQGNFKEFVVVDAQRSLAAQQSFTDKIGLITAVFYKPKSGSRGGRLGTAAGNDLAADLTERAGVTAGVQIGVLQIRYVDADALTATRN